MRKKNSIFKINRRDFLKLSGTGAALLVGNAFISGRGLSKNIIEPRNKFVSISLHGVVWRY